MKALWAIVAVQLALTFSCPGKDYSAEEIREVFKRIQSTKEDGDITEVLKRMKEGSFPEREAAQRELEGMFWVSAEWIASHAKKDDPELRYRLERIGKRAEQTGLDLLESIKRVGADQFAGELFELGATVSRNRNLWREILKVIQAFDGKVENIDILKENLTHRHPEFRRVALVLLDRSSPEIGQDAALKLLGDDDDTVVMQATDLLIRKGEKRAAEAAVRLLSSSNRDVRWEAHNLLCALAGKKLTPFEEEGDPTEESLVIWKGWLVGQPNPIPLPEEGIDEMALKLSSDGVRTLKRSYRPSEEIIVEVEKFSGSETDWVTIVEKATPDTNYNQYFYGEGKKTGRFTFNGLPVGEYEVRVFHNWPDGGYEVKARSAFRVLAR